jgi:hypothetical protein
MLAWCLIFRGAKKGLFRFIDIFVCFFNGCLNFCSGVVFAVYSTDVWLLVLLNLACC